MTRQRAANRCSQSHLDTPSGHYDRLKGGRIRIDALGQAWTPIAEANTEADAKANCCGAASDHSPEPAFL